MGQKPEREAPAIRGDRLDLDFGKNAFRIGEKARRPEPPGERKLPPVPGRAPPATSVPLSEILDSDLDRRKD